MRLTFKAYFNTLNFSSQQIYSPCLLFNADSAEMLLCRNRCKKAFRERVHLKQIGHTFIINGNIYVVFNSNR